MSFLNAGWHDEWLSLLVTVGTATQKRRHQYASVITDEVLSIYLFFSSFLPFSLFPPSTFTPCRFSAFNQFPCSISKHVLCVTVRAFLTLSTLSERAHALVIRECDPFILLISLWFFKISYCLNKASKQEKNTIRDLYMWHGAVWQHHLLLLFS